MQAMYGVVLGAVLMPTAHQPAIQLPQLWGAGGATLVGSRALWAARRLVAGFAVVALLKEAAKAFFLVALPLLYCFFPLAVRRLWQPPVHNLAAPPATGAAVADTAATQQEQQRHGSGVRRRAAAQAASAAAGDGPEGDAAPAAAAKQAAAPPQDPRLAELPHDAQGRPWDVVVTSRFLSYTAMGMAVAGVAPRILAALHW